MAVNRRTFFNQNQITGVLLYSLFLLIFLADDEEDEEEKQKIATSRQTVIELEVPAKAAGAIIGRQGANIKEVWILKKKF